MNKSITVAVTVPVTVILDLYTKYIAARGITPFEPIELTSFFNLVNVQNRGAAFGMFHELGNGFFIGISLAAICFVIYLLVREDEPPFPLSLIISGALGNLYDRITLGYVRDFLDFHAAGYHWPAFNVADSALTVGLSLLVVQAFWDLKWHKKTGPDVPPEAGE